jgi:hypothetical protein
MFTKLGPGQAKIKFTSMEDARLKELVGQYGTNNWAAVASDMGDRTARQCRERWTNYINPTIIFSPWTPDEEALLDQKFAEYGSSWQAIAVFFPTRSKNQIKNHWTTRRKHGSTIRLTADREVTTDQSAETITPIDRSVKTATLCEIMFSERDYEQFRWDDLFSKIFE